MAIAGAVGCAAKAGPAPRSPVTALGDSDVQVALFWTPEVDLDLYVTDPKQETVYFANPKSGTGGQLERDQGCKEGSKPGADRSEVVRWQRPPAGRYRVGVDFMEPCGSRTDSVSFRVVIEVSGTRKEQVGKVSRNIFEPVVIEFDVPEGRKEGS